MRYTVRTKQLVEREYEIDVTMPFADNGPFADRYVHSLASGGTMMSVIEAGETTIPVVYPREEKIVRVEGVSGQVWPRVRKRKAIVMTEPEPTLPLSGVEDE